MRWTGLHLKDLSLIDRSELRGQLYSGVILTPESKVAPETLHVDTCRFVVSWIPIICIPPVTLFGTFLPSSNRQDRVAFS